MKCIYVLGLCGALAFLGCKKELPKNRTPLGPVTSTPIKTLPKPLPPKSKTVKYAVGGKAAKVYETRCALCHGAHGAGDGVGAMGSPIKPRSFADTEWQTSATDAHIKKIIVQGGTAVGMSALMPANGDLLDKPKVLDGLVKIIRGFGK